MARAKNVTVIPAKVNPVTGKVDITRKKRRVAGYARVSTDSDECSPAMKPRWIITSNSFRLIRTGNLSGVFESRDLRFEHEKPRRL